jgi:hypothetical protein
MICADRTRGYIGCGVIVVVVRLVRQGDSVDSGSPCLVYRNE